jgi:hypothetical protein
MGEENYEQFNQEIQGIQDEFFNELRLILDNIPDIHCPLESTDLYFNTSILELINIITNLISHFYF